MEIKVDFRAKASGGPGSSLSKYLSKNIKNIPVQKY